MTTGVYSILGFVAKLNQLQDPEPLGASSLKPRVDLIGRAISVLPAPRPSNIPDFETVLAFEMESAGQIFSFSIDARSADFLAHAMQFYLTDRSSL
jgi:hypothetical protein